LPGASRDASGAWLSRLRPHGGSKVRERLTGAIILVVLIVLLVPELLTGPVRSAPRPTAVEAAAEGAPLRSYTINLSDDRSRSAAPQANGPEQPAPLAAATNPAPPETAAPQGQAAVAPATAEPQTPSATGAAPAAPAPAAAATTHAPSTPPAHSAASKSSPPSASGAFMVQLGSFASRANADRLAQEVRTRGFPVSVSQGSSGRKLYRVRVGPARDHAAAEDLAAKLRAAGHPGSVVPR
jgi:cell division septation protein DedD